MSKIEEFLENLYQNKVNKFEKNIVNQIYKEAISLEILDKHSYLEKYLLQHLKKTNLDNNYFMSIIKLINYKFKDNIFVWDFQTNIQKFDIIFQFIIDQQINNFQNDEIIEIIKFLILHFQKLEYDFISNKILKFISSPLLLKTSKVYLKSYLLEYPYLIDLVKQLLNNKKISNSPEAMFFPKIFDILFEKINDQNLCQTILQFFTDLLSQLSTRKFLKPYLKGNFLIPKLKIKGIQNIDLLQKLINFPLNDEIGDPLSNHQIQIKRSDFLKRLQIGLFKNFDQQFTLLEITSLQFLKQLQDPTNNLMRIFNFMGIPLPEEQDFEFLKVVFQDFIPEDIEQELQEMPLIPSEEQLWPLKKQNFLKLNLQFLSVQDYLYRNFFLLQLESCYEIAQDIENCIERMSPKFDDKKNFIEFEGWSRNGVQTQQIQMHQVLQPKIGQNAPQRVFAEITYSVSQMPNYLRKEWESLKKYDVIFLVGFGQNQNKIEKLQKYNIQKIRGCEIVDHLDEEKNPIENQQKGQINILLGNLRTLNVLFDNQQYRIDFQNQNLLQNYQDLKLIIRRKSKENNFKAQLQSIKNLYLKQPELPLFLDQVLLGYGKSDQQIQSNFLKNINLFDTFINKEHFQKSFLENELLPQDLKQNLKYEQNLKTQKPNKIRFTKDQIKGIFCSIQEGLTLIKGPPGTGKTDVVVQAIALLYRNFPRERILVLTHSNQALNDIFEKIKNMDSIEERHLLRLGMGGDKVYGEKQDFSFGRMGRINYLLKRRLDLLQTAKEFANSINYQEDNFTCETAEIFFNFQVKPRWEEFLQTGDFPFKDYFQESYDNYNSCYQKIENLFEEIKQLRFLEILRNNSERGDSFQCRYARVLAMTCTHAALKREKLLEIGFEYDSVVCEEQGQILEISTFIAINLQKQQKLKRLILVGDENQLPPVIKNSELQKQGFLLIYQKSIINYIKGNMEQSMFKRFIRLGFNIINLQNQGRSRPQMLKLFNWQYPYLNNLPELENPQPPSEYAYANIGFQHEFQFINVQGREIQPQQYFYQNLEEAEFIVATFMYLRIKGIPAEKITILTTYNGQKYLLRDIIHQKCSWNSFFQRPLKITTVDKYQGQQNDIILLSLVRTYHVGHLRDPRRLVVAMSRARLGLYVFGKLELFDGYSELEKCIDIFKQKPNKLCLLINEKEKERLINDQKGEITQVENQDQMYSIVKLLLQEQIV